MSFKIEILIHYETDMLFKKNQMNTIQMFLYDAFKTIMESVDNVRKKK